MIWAFDKYKDSVAITDDNGISIKYGELIDISRTFSEYIAERCLIFCMCRNTIGGLLGYISSLQSGIVPLMLSEDIDKTLFNNLLGKYHPKYIWAPDDIKWKEDLVCTEYKIYDYRLYKIKFDNVKLYDELALLLTTSGSTGSPKLVRQSYENIHSNTKSIVEYLNIDENERAITTLPINYTYGLSVINTHLFAGATILLTQKTFFQKEFWEFFKEQKATSFAGVPYTYAMLKKLRFFRMELPSLRTMTQAGGKLDIELQQEIGEYAKKNNIGFYIMYGASEATARMSYLPQDKCLEKPGSIGIAIPGGKLQLVNENGLLINQYGEIGELQYTGDNVTLGYAECCEDLSKADERNKVLLTGDMAYFDHDGYFYIKGRKKRFLKVFGNRIGLDETEQLLTSRFDNIEFACTGKDDMICVCYVGDCKEDVIRDYLAQTINIHYSAIKVCRLEAMPRNDSGKIRYLDLKEYYAV